MKIIEEDKEKQKLPLKKQDKKHLRLFVVACLAGAVVISVISGMLYSNINSGTRRVERLFEQVPEEATLKELDFILYHDHVIRTEVVLFSGLQEGRFNGEINEASALETTDEQLPTLVKVSSGSVEEYLNSPASLEPLTGSIMIELSRKSILDYTPFWLSPAVVDLEFSDGRLVNKKLGYRPG